MSDSSDPVPGRKKAGRHWQPDLDERSFRTIISAVIVVTALAATAMLFLGLIVVQFGKGYWITVALDHFPAVIGLPCAGCTALVVVIILRSVEGPIEFEGLGFKFKGASGPVVLWVLCFIAIASSIKLLWPLTTTWR